MTDVIAFADAVRTLPRIGQSLVAEARTARLEATLQPCDDLLHRCQNLFHAEVCAIFLVQNGEAVLEAQVGYTGALGTPIGFDELRRNLRYRLGPVRESDGVIYDGITGWVASTGNEFGANSWNEIRLHPSYAGKPDRLGIWNEHRPFRCVFAVPLKLAGDTIGVLKVENKRERHDKNTVFDDTDKQLMRMLADLFSMAIHHAERPDAGTPIHVYGLPDEAISSTQTLLESAIRFDRYHMAGVISDFPRQIDRALAQELPLIKRRRYARVFLAGMGSSASPMDVVVDAFGRSLQAPVQVIRNYDLPSPTNIDTLVIACSFSGTTEEALAVVEHQPRGASNVVVLAGGGRLLALGTERRYPVVRIPVEQEPIGFQPRCAVGYMATYLARILFKAGVLLDDPGAELSAAASFLRSCDPRREAEAVAEWLRDRTPIIYTDETHLMSVARTTKIKFNENAKRVAFFNALPEANHNEMIGFAERRGRFGILYLHDSDSHPRIPQRFHLMKRVFEWEKLHHVAFRRWDLPGTNRVERVFSALVFAEWCSYTLALLEGLDPTPVELVERFKELLVKETEK